MILAIEPGLHASTCRRDRSRGLVTPRRVGVPDEIADAVLFVMTNSYTNGIVLDVDSGHVVRQYATR